MRERTALAWSLAIFHHKISTGTNQIQILKYVQNINYWLYGIVTIINILWYAICSFSLSLMIMLSVVAVVNPLLQLDLFVYTMETNKHLNSGNNSQWQTLVFNEDYQKNISDQLRYIYINHLKFLEYNRFLNRFPQTKFVGAMLTLCGFTYFLLGVMRVFIFNSIQGYVIGVPTIVVIIFYTEILLGAGQLMEDKYASIHKTLVNMSWYAWNKENMKTYLLICTQSYKPVQSIYGFNNVLNREAFLIYVKAYYAFFMFIYQTNVLEKFKKYVH